MELWVFGAAGWGGRKGQQERNRGRLDIFCPSWGCCGSELKGPGESTGGCRDLLRSSMPRTSTWRCFSSRLDLCKGLFGSSLFLSSNRSPFCPPHPFFCVLDVDPISAQHGWQMWECLTWEEVPSLCLSLSSSSLGFFLGCRAGVQPQPDPYVGADGGASIPTATFPPCWSNDSSSQLLKQLLKLHQTTLLVSLRALRL